MSGPRPMRTRLAGRHVALQPDRDRAAAQEQPRHRRQPLPAQLLKREVGGTGCVDARPAAHVLAVHEELQGVRRSLHARQAGRATSPPGPGGWRPPGRRRDAGSSPPPCGGRCGRGVASAARRRRPRRRSPAARRAQPGGAPSSPRTGWGRRDGRRRGHRRAPRAGSSGSCRPYAPLPVIAGACHNDGVSELDPQVAALLKRNPDGLVPAIVQDATTRRVLMLAWMDDEALRRTLTTRKGTYWSRSRAGLLGQGRDQRQHPGRPRGAPRLRRRHPARGRRPDRPGLPHRHRHLLRRRPAAGGRGMSPEITIVPDLAGVPRRRRGAPRGQRPRPPAGRRLHPGRAVPPALRRPAEHLPAGVGGGRCVVALLLRRRLRRAPPSPSRRARRPGCGATGRSPACRPVAIR